MISPWLWGNFPIPAPGALVTSLVQTLRPEEVEVVSPVATVTCEADCSSVVERFLGADMAGFDGFSMDFKWDSWDIIP